MKKIILSLMFVVFLSTFSNAQKSSGSNAKFILVSWDEWGRASLKCRGWGLCNANWFHCSPDPCFGKNGSSNYFSQLQFNEEKNVFYFNVLLDNITKEKFISENLSTLPIDIDIVLHTKELLGRDLIISKGEYSFDQTTNSYLIILK